MLTVLVCGGRDYEDEDRLFAVLDELRPSTVVHGGARGADRLAGRWARSREVTQMVFNADWDRFGKSAGHRRNGEMANELLDRKRRGWPTLVVAFPGGKGTRNMVETSIRRGLTVRVVGDADDGA